MAMTRSTSPRPKPRRLRRQPLWLIYGFMFPAVALALIFDYYPALSGLYLSMTNTLEIGITSQFIGFSNLTFAPRNHNKELELKRHETRINTGFLV